MSEISAAERDAYWEHGYLLVRQLFDAAELADLQAECERLAELAVPAASDPGQTLPRTDSSGQRVRNRLDPVMPYSPIVRGLLEHPRLTGCLRELWGQEARLFKDKLILRQPGTRGYRLHQDFAHYGWTGAAPDELLAVQIAVDPADASNGALQLYPNQHHALLPDEPSSASRLRATALADIASVLPETEPGDALFFHSLTPHWSDENRSTRHRRTLYLSYNAASAGDLYRIYYREHGELVQ